VLAQAIMDQTDMRRAGHALSVSVNISGRLLGDAEFAEVALQMIAAAEGDICLEITETAVIENPELGLAVIERFAAAGVAISIDDYGTGLSSLAYLKQIRASELKIDKAFVVAVADSQRDALLVRSTVDLAHGLGMKVTAEGVETPTALALLSSMGCDLIQGYFIARPMPLNDLLMFMDQEKQTARTYG
jgi:EAL domain-containing protein (putative c-di-GMP-specific phosphodiesterase class I)